MRSIRPTRREPIWQAAINSTTPGQPEEHFLAQIKSQRGQGQLPVPRDWSLPRKIEALIRASWKGDFAVLEGSHQIDLVSHRVVLTQTSLRQILLSAWSLFRARSTGRSLPIRSRPGGPTKAKRDELGV